MNWSKRPGQTIFRTLCEKSGEHWPTNGVRAFVKRLLSLAFVLTVSSAMVFAQSSGPAKAGSKPPVVKSQGSHSGGPGQKGMQFRGRMKQMEERVLAKLNLTAQQKASIKALDEKTAKSLTAVRPAPKAGQKPERPTKAQMDKISAIVKGRHDGLMKILNTKQQASYKTLMDKEMKAWREERAKQRGKSGKPGTPPAKTSKP